MRSALPRLADAAALALALISINANLNFAIAGEQADVTVLYYEPLSLLPNEPAANSGISLPAAIEESTQLAFEAYGQRFVLLNDESPALNSHGFEVFKGKLEGLTDSWFRVLHKDGEFSGIINDGNNVYLIEPLRRVYDALIDQPTDNDVQNIIFRLADTLIPAGVLACDTVDVTSGPAEESNPGKVSGEAAYATLSAELNAAVALPAAVNRTLVLGTVADVEYTRFHLDNSTDDIAAVLNIMQGIYDNELGLTVTTDSITLITEDDANPFSDTALGTTLLTELRDWRVANQLNTDISHLLTRKRLVNAEDDLIAGIAYLEGVCGAFGASISRDYGNDSNPISFLTALIVTHEMGHNLGSPHDGEDACINVASNDFIMAPTLSPSSVEQFSNCSINQMTPVINSASCLTATEPSTPSGGSSNSGGSNGGGGGGGGALRLISVMTLGLLTLVRRSRYFR